MNQTPINGKSATAADGSDSGKTAKQRQFFFLTPAAVFTNLHRLAAKEAAKKMGETVKDPDAINHFVINSGLSDDGRTIARDNAKIEQGSTMRFMGSDGKFEVGVVLQCNGMKKLDHSAPEDEKRKVMADNRKLVESTRKTALAGLNEYFRMFASEENRFTESDLVQFTPPPSGQSVRLDKGRIVGLEGKDNDTDRSSDEQKVRLGFKVGYTIRYNK